MKTYLLCMLAALLLISNCNGMVAQSTDLGKLTKAERNKYLIKMGNELTKTYGPGYFRIAEKPVLSKAQKFKPHDNRTEIAQNIDRQYYEITFPYNKTNRQLEWNYASIVSVWKDTGEPFSILFGNGMGFNFFFKSHKEHLQSGNIQQIPYEEVPETVSIWQTPEQTVDETPCFPSLSPAQFAVNHISWPFSLFRKHKDGKAICQFTINEEGYAVNPVILQATHRAFAREALRIIGLMPQWIPAMINNRPVPYTYVLTIPFVYKEYKQRINNHPKRKQTKKHQTTLPF